jgi:excisionase family DNA binding protein
MNQETPNSNGAAGTPKKELEPLWTPQQVAQYLSVHPVTVYRWLSEGKVIDPAKVKRVSNRVRIPRSEVVRIAGTIRDNLMNQ